MSDRCQFTRCRGPVSLETDRVGRIVAVCAWCTRRRAGLCRDCPRPVAGTVGKAVRCAEHHAAAQREHTRRYEDRHRKQRQRQGRIDGRTEKRRQQKAARYQRWIASLTQAERAALHRFRYKKLVAMGYVRPSQRKAA